MTVESDIKDALKGGRLLIGTRSIMKAVKSGSISEVIVASNCPAGTKKDLNHYAGIYKLKLKEFKGDSARLGESCGKPFNILMLGVRK